MQQTCPADAVQRGSQLGIARRHVTVVGQSAHLGRQFGGVRVVSVPEQTAQFPADDLDVVAVEQRRIQDHRTDAAGVPHAHSGREVAAVGGAVDGRARYPGVVENGGDVVDHLLDGQRRLRQVGTGVVMARHADTAVLDHDDVQARIGGAPAQSLVVADRGHSGPTGDDHQRLIAARAGADVVEVELLRRRR